MPTYAEQVQPYINFESSDEMDKHFNLFRKKHRYDITEGENKALFTLNGFAFKFPGACKVTPEKVAKVAGISVATVNRAISKAAKFGIIKRFKTRKDNGRKQGVTVYQFQRFELELDRQVVIDSQNNEKPCERKVEGLKFELYSLILLLPSLKVLKDTNITGQAHSEKKVDKETVLKNALLDKLPEALRGLSLFFDKSQDIYGMTGLIFAAKDKSVRIEEHEGLFRKTIRSVYEYWTRQVRKGNKDYNVFGLMRKAISEMSAKIIAGLAYNKPVKNEAEPARKFEQMPKWMSVDKTKFNSRELVPDWFGNRNAEAPKETPSKAPEIDFEAERQKILSKLGN